MLNKSVFKAETRRGRMFQKVLSAVATSVYADEGETTPKPVETNEPPTPQINYEQLIVQARKEEKDKLYPRIEKLEKENKTLTSSHNKTLLENAALKEELDKMKSKDDSEEVKNLKTEVATLTQEINTLKESTPNEEAIRQKIAEEYEIKLYIKEQIAENSDTILTFLHSEVTGSTKEEVDKSILSVKEKTLSVKKDLGLEVGEVDDSTPPKGDPKPKPKPKKVPPAVPPTTSEEKYDTEYIRNLDPSSEEYKEFRKKVGLK